MKGKSLVVLIVAVLLAAGLGAGGAYATYSGLIDLPALLSGGGKSGGKGGGDGHDKPKRAGYGGPKAASHSGSVVYVDIGPLVVSLSGAANADHLQVKLSIETAPEHLAEIEHLSPRIKDTLNTFLRAVDERDFAEPANMLRLRAQMLRRVRLVAGEDQVGALLVTEFILQ